jgi:hypothetical protein
MAPAGQQWRSLKVSGVGCQHRRWLEKQPVKSKKKLMNIERPTSNNVFCRFKIKAGQSGTSLRNSI